MPGTDLLPYAAKSLKERMITRILEREDEGHLRWTPAGIYEQLSLQNPEMYPEDVSPGIYRQFHEDAFMEELAGRRMQRRISQLPARMLADTIGRRIVDLATPILFEQLAGRVLDFGEVRKVLKDALSYAVANEEAMLGKHKGKGDEKEDAKGLSLEDAKNLLVKMSPERQQGMAEMIGMQLLADARALASETIDGEAVEG